MRDSALKLPRQRLINFDQLKSRRRAHARQRFETTWTLQAAMAAVASEKSSCATAL